jgi:hypothetical protein
MNEKEVARLSAEETKKWMPMFRYFVGSKYNLVNSKRNVGKNKCNVDGNKHNVGENKYNFANGKRNLEENKYILNINI